MNGQLPLPPVLSSKLSDFRRRVWVVKLAEGVLAAVFGLAVSYLLVLGLDRFMETPAWLRGILLVLGALVPGLGLPLKWHKWVWRQRRLEDAAKLDKNGNISVPVGKVSFTEAMLAENTKAVIDSVVRARPASAKGKFITNIHVAATMSPGLKIDSARYLGVVAD